MLPLLLATACFRSEPSDPAPQVGPGFVDHVVILTLDGARTDETTWGAVSSLGVTAEDILPRIRHELLPQGTEELPGINLGVPATAESHAEMLTGRRLPEATIAVQETPGWFLPEAPTLFEAARGQLGLDADQVVMVANFHPLDALAWSLYPGLSEVAGTVLDEPTADGETGTLHYAAGIHDDGPVVEMLMDRMEDADVRLALANLHWIDGAAHIADADAYLDALRHADDLVTDFWAWVQQTPPYADDTLLFVLADHGRHRSEGADDWKGHGGSCNGCRQILYAALGPGVSAGVVRADTWTPGDVAGTAAWALGLEVPWSDGLVLEPLFEGDLSLSGRQGDAAVAANGGVTALETWTRDAERRSRVQVDGVVLSSPDAILAEAPSVLDTSAGAFACWRDLVLAPDHAQDGMGSSSWAGRCALRPTGETAWTDLVFDQAANPYSRYALGWDAASSALYVAYAENAEGTGSLAFPHAVHLARWTGTWEGMDLDDGTAQVAYPLDASLAFLGGVPFVAYVTSDTLLAALELESLAYTRHVQVDRVGWTDHPVWSTVLSLEVNDGFGSADAVEARQEHPALTATEGGLSLAWVAYGDGIGGSIGLSTSPDGIAWTPPVYLDDTGRVVGLVPPTWALDGRLLWVRLDTAGGPEVCRRGLLDASATCVSAGAPYVRALAATSTGAQIAACDGTGTCDAQELGF